jgi:hypothetical protein
MLDFTAEELFNLAFEERGLTNLQKVLKKIKECAASGHTSLFNHIPLSDADVKYLKNKGFKVSNLNASLRDPDFSRTISWSHF